MGIAGELPSSCSDSEIRVREEEEGGLDRGDGEGVSSMKIGALGGLG